jgi:hypothetical protein
MARTPSLRLLRSAVFAAVCTAMSGLGHAMMSGAGVPVWALLYAFAGVTAVAWWATGRQRGGPAVLAGTVVTQFTLHCLFTLGQMIADAPAAGPGMPAASAGSGATSSMPGMAMPATSGAGGPGGGMTMHEWSLGMLLAHTAAALVCGLWLWRGEVAVHRMVRALAWMLTAPLRVVLAACAPAVPSAAPLRTDAAPRVRSAGVLLRHAVARRGPPPLVALS